MVSSRRGAVITKMFRGGRKNFHGWNPVKKCKPQGTGEVKTGPKKRVSWLVVASGKVCEK